MSAFAEVLCQIAQENKARRHGNDAVAWTWEQWDRMIAAGEKHGVPVYCRMAFEKTKERVAKARADGLSPWQFHVALNYAIAALEPKTYVPAGGEDPQYRKLVNEAVMREQARAEAREIVGRPKRKAPEPAAI